MNSYKVRYRREVTCEIEVEARDADHAAQRVIHDDVGDEGGGCSNEEELDAGPVIVDAVTLTWEDEPDDET